MPDLVIRLLGRPKIERDGEIGASPRGHKAWAVLAYLALAERPVPRAHLAELIFTSANDPLGALRWTLAELRRALALNGVLQGDPLHLALPERAWIDVLALQAASDEDAGAALVSGELLEGIQPDAGPTFDAWLLVERRRLMGVSVGLLHDAALGALARGRDEEAVELASRALAFDPFDESMNELLVRALAATGATAAALEQADACDALFRRELGRTADPRIRRAADPGEAAAAAAVGDRAAAVGQLEAGVAALDAGAVEPGVACLRQACAEARACGDTTVLAEALLTLGVALVHAVRGRDEEGAALLHEALVLAEEIPDAEIAGRACRQLGFVEVQAGRASAAGRWLQRADGFADGAPERAAVLGIRGMALSDRAHYAAAVRLLEESVIVAERCEESRQAAWSLAILGRAELLRGRHAAANASIGRSLELVEELGWIAFQPLPEALGAEARLAHGDLDGASEMLEHAFSLSCRLGDPCWEALAARADGMVCEARGDREAALARMRDAVTRATRVPDAYAWVTAHCLDALAGVAIAAGDPQAGAHVERLEELAARSDMRELVVRAAGHRALLGDSAGLSSARELAAAIGNPLLDETLAAAS